MPRLRRVDCSRPGIVRRRAGRGFVYEQFGRGRVSDPETLQRIADLAIPPAWTDVWICPYPNGHIQATGVDAAGRRQYRYHDDWRTRRDGQKFDRMLEFGKALPEMRGGTRDMAAAVIGANVIPIPVPVITSAGSNVRQLVVVDT